MLNQLNEVNRRSVKKKDFKNFESEMEDYEPVEEEKELDDSEEEKERDPDYDPRTGRRKTRTYSDEDEVADVANVPVPAFGEIDYYRHLEATDQQWM